MIKELSIKGLRGFSTKQTSNFSVPDNINEGSGLTFIAGANNTGKSTIIEALKSFTVRSSPSYSVGKRNKKAGDKIDISALDELGNKHTIASSAKGGSTTKRSKQLLTIHHVPSRRNFNARFGNTKYTNNIFVSSESNNIARSNVFDNFECRINEINETSYNSFNNILAQIIGEKLDWTIDQDESSENYIKITYGSSSHNSEGAGEGIVSAMVIAAAILDSKPNETIIIDEPELSLHPTLQKNLMKLLKFYSKDRQIIICTHSLFFIDWESFKYGASLIRTAKEGEDCKIYHADTTILKNIANLGLEDNFNPHLVGLTANEVFFLNDNIILVEGQEDVIFYNKAIKKLGLELNGSFFGWGCGGASKIKNFIELFHSLGFKHVTAIFDGDQKAEYDKCVKNYSSYNYKFLILPKNDIRDKEEIKHKDAKEGMCDKHGNLKSENESNFKDLINEIIRYNKI